MKQIRKAVIPAAGWGTRFLPATKAIPKEMMPIVNKPAIQYVIEEVAEAGIREILVITSKSKTSIEDHFDRCGELEALLETEKKNNLLERVAKSTKLAHLYFIRQQEQRGLGHAVACARDFVGEEPFVVLLPDDLVLSTPSCTKQLMAFYKERPGSYVAVKEVAAQEVSSYGIIDPVEMGENLFKIKDMVEKPGKEEAPSSLAIVGRYLLEPEIFYFLDRVKPGAGKELQLTDALKMLALETNVYAHKFEGERYDVGCVEGFIKANMWLGAEHLEFGRQIKKEMLAILGKSI